MNKETSPKLFHEAKEYYFKIGKVRCPILDNEEIEFGAQGWRHILIKNGVPRPTEDMLRRFKILKFSLEIIRKGKLTHYQHTYKHSQLAKFWRLKCEIKGVIYKIIVRQVGSGPKNFFSIMY